MNSDSVSVVTGAFGYSGRYIARRLLDAGGAVRTLTNAPASRDPFGGRVKSFPLSFDDHNRLVDAMDGCDVLYNTYWVRFNHDSFKHADAVANTLALFRAARDARVRRVVHVSITNPSEDSPLEYFRGKAILEKALIESRLSHAILRPTVLFGQEDVLVNNIAWLLRRVPFFGVFGDGHYRLQPIFVDDLAKIAVREGGRVDDRITDAIGPETFTFRELVETIGIAIGKRRSIVSVSPGVGYIIGRLVGRLMDDVVITREEIEGLMSGLLCTTSKPTGETKLSEWAREHRDTLGVRYANELGRRLNRSAAPNDRESVRDPGRIAGADEQWSNIDWCDARLFPERMLDTEVIHALARVNPYSGVLPCLLDEALRRRLRDAVTAARTMIDHPVPDVVAPAADLVGEFGGVSDLASLTAAAASPYSPRDLASILGAIVRIDPSRASWAFEQAQQEFDPRIGSLPEVYLRTFVLGAVMAGLAQSVPDDDPDLEAKLLEWGEHPGLHHTHRAPIFERLSRVPRTERIEDFFVNWCVHDDGSDVRLTQIVNDALRST